MKCNLCESETLAQYGITVCEEHQKELERDKEIVGYYRKTIKRDEVLVCVKISVNLARFVFDNNSIDSGDCREITEQIHEKLEEMVKVSKEIAILVSEQAY